MVTSRCDQFLPHPVEMRAHLTFRFFAVSIENALDECTVFVRRAAGASLQSHEPNPHPVPLCVQIRNDMPGALVARHHKENVMQVNVRLPARRQDRLRWKPFPF